MIGVVRAVTNVAAGYLCVSVAVGALPPMFAMLILLIYLTRVVLEIFK